MKPTDALVGRLANAPEDDEPFDLADIEGMDDEPRVPHDEVIRMPIPFRNLTAFAHVRDVEASIAFYRLIGFEVGARFPEEGTPNWVWLHSGGDGAQLMIARATEPVVAEQQAVFFYLYVDDVAAKRAELAAAGIAVGEIATPFYAPRGEFRIVDPDGYGLTITHT